MRGARIISSVTAALVLMLGALCAAARADVTVVVNDHPLAAPARIEGARVLVAMRPIFEALGAAIVYDAVDRHIIAQTSGHLISLDIGSRDASVDGAVVHLDVPPRLYDGRTYVPIRFIAESLGATVSYDPGRQLVAIRTQSAPAVAQYAAIPAPDEYPASSFNPVSPQLTLDSGRIVYPGQSIDAMLVAPPGGFAFLNVCNGYSIPLYAVPASPFYRTQFPVDFSYDVPYCSVYAVYTYPNGTQEIIPLGYPITLYVSHRHHDEETPPPPLRPQPVPSAAPTPHFIHGGPIHVRLPIEPMPTPLPRVPLAPPIVRAPLPPPPRPPAPLPAAPHVPPPAPPVVHPAPPAVHHPAAPPVPVAHPHPPA